MMVSSFCDGAIGVYVALGFLAELVVKTLGLRPRLSLVAFWGSPATLRPFLDEEMS